MAIFAVIGMIVGAAWGAYATRKWVYVNRVPYIFFPIFYGRGNRCYCGHRFGYIKRENSKPIKSIYPL